MYQLRLLGSLRLADPSGAVSASVVRQRPLAVLALLAVAREAGCSRDKLIGYLWPEVEPERARHRLADAIYLLRKSLGEDAVLAAGDTVRLNPEVVAADAACFLERLDGNDLEAAVELYRGPLLDGFYVSGASEFERWVELERQRLADSYAGALEELAERAEAVQDFRRAIDWWKRLAAHDPYNSRCVLRLMQALASAGDRGNALQLAQEHERRLSEELGIEPDAEFRALMGGLRNEAGRELQAVGDVALERDSGESQAEPGHGPSAPRELAAGADSFDRVAAASERRVVPGRRHVGGLRGLVTRRRAIIGGAAAIGLLGIAVSAYLGMRVMGVGRWGTLIGRGVLEERDLIVLADFEDNTGDSVLALTVTEAMRVRLEQSPVVRVADDAYLGQVLERMERDPDAPLTSDLAREVAIREGLKAVVTGQVNAAGSGYVLSSRLVAGETGETLDSFLETAADPDAIIPAIDRLSAGVRERIGESLKTVRASPPLSRVRTASLEVLRLLTMAAEANRRGDRKASLEFYSRAVEFDTLCALAYRGRAVILGNLGIEREQQIADITKAFELRGRQPLAMQYEVEGMYHVIVTGDREKAISAFRMAMELSPDQEPGANLAQEYRVVRDYQRAEEIHRRIVSVDSLAGSSWSGLASNEFEQGKFEEAWETVRIWEMNVPDDPRIHQVRAHFAAAQGAYDAAGQHIRGLLATAPGSLRRSGLVSSFLAAIAQVQGKLMESERLYRDAMRIYEEAGLTTRYLNTAVEIGNLNIFIRGMHDRGVKEIEAALERHPLSGQEPLDRPYISIAWSYATAGKPGRARELLAEYEAVIDTVLRRRSDNSRRLTLGWIAMVEGRPLEAVEEIRRVTQRHATPIYGLTSLGRAYEVAGQPDSAIAVYERFVSTPYGGRLAYDRLWLPYIYERLGDLYEQRADTAKAVYYYGKLVELWKEADPELQPRVEASRRALEALTADT